MVKVMCKNKSGKQMEKRNQILHELCTIKNSNYVVKNIHIDTKL